MSVRDPGNFKKRKVVGVMKQKVPGSAASTTFEGTAVSHYIQSINDKLDIMDEFSNMKGFHIAMENVPMYSTDLVDSLIIERGYMPVYLLSYSPVLNLLNNFGKF